MLVDDHEIVRRGIADLIGTADDLEVVGEASGFVLKQVRPSVGDKTRHEQIGAVRTVRSEEGNAVGSTPAFESPRMPSQPRLGIREPPTRGLTSINPVRLPCAASRAATVASRFCGANTSPSQALTGASTTSSRRFTVLG